MWLTDAQIYNPDAVDTIEVRFAFLARGQANSDPDEVTISIEPFGFLQINNVFKEVGHEGSLQPNAVVEFLATEDVLAYGSVVDNTSGDAIFVTPSADSGTPPPGNNPPASTINQPAADVSIAPGETVFFSASANDPDGDDVTVLWDFGDGMTSTELEPGDHTYTNQGTFTVTLTRIQNEIFSPPCASCHGGGSPTAGLNLDSGQSYGNLVNVPASTEPGTRVIPSDPDNSVLVTFLEDGHRSRPQSETDLIRDWVISGAPNN